MTHLVGGIDGHIGDAGIEVGADVTESDPLVGDGLDGGDSGASHPGGHARHGTEVDLVGGLLHGVDAAASSRRCLPTASATLEGQQCCRRSTYTYFP